MVAGVRGWSVLVEGREGVVLVLGFGGVGWRRPVGSGGGVRCSRKAMTLFIGCPAACASTMPVRGTSRVWWGFAADLYRVG